jgi:hypothetical protein
MSDVPVWSDRRRIERCRNRLFSEKWRRIGELNYLTRICHAAAVRLANPEATEREVRRQWLLFNLGEKLLNEITAAGRDLYQGLPDDSIIVEGRTDDRG